MANHDFVLVYRDGIEQWLRGEGCCVPTVLPGNRYPTMQEVVAAVEAEGLQALVNGEDIMVLPPRDAPSSIEAQTHTLRYMEVSGGEVVESAVRSPVSYLVLIHSYRWDELNVNETASITMRGNFPLELFLVRRLTERCGQLVLYPDTGDPPVVIESGDDVGRIASVWLEAVSDQISWAEFYRRIAAPS